MADLTTYEGLKTAIADYLGREDLSDRIPVFIRLWEQRGNRTLRLRAMEHRAHASLPKGQGQMPLPMKRVPGQWDVFLEMRDIVWTPSDGNGSVNLWYASPDEYALLLEKTGRYRLRFLLFINNWWHAGAQMFRRAFWVNGRDGNDGSYGRDGSYGNEKKEEIWIFSCFCVTLALKNQNSR